LLRDQYAGGVAVAVDFSKNWGNEIADVTESLDYQTCEIRINWSSETIEAFDYKTGESYLVSKEVNELGLQMIKVGDSDPTFPDLVAEMHDLLGVEDTADVFVQQEEPTGIEGDIWVKKVDRSAVAFILEDTTWVAAPVETVVYSGQARFIPVRAGVWQGGEAQVNTTTIRAVRFQLKRSAMPTRIHAGAIITITSAPFNQNLVGRTAKVDDDFQGATTATRTIHAMMDADSEDS
jgi:hypothetical protein